MHRKLAGTAILLAVISLISQNDTVHAKDHDLVNNCGQKVKWTASELKEFQKQGWVLDEKCRLVKVRTQKNKKLQRLQAPAWASFKRTKNKGAF